MNMSISEFKGRLLLIYLLTILQHSYACHPGSSQVGLPPLLQIIRINLTYLAASMV